MALESLELWYHSWGIAVRFYKNYPYTGLYLRGWTAQNQKSENFCLSPTIPTKRNCLRQDFDAGRGAAKGERPPPHSTTTRISSV